MTALLTVTQQQTLFWQAATYLILLACLAIIVGAAFALAHAFIRGALDDDDPDRDTAAATSARLGSAYRAGSDVPEMHVLPRGVARVGPARHTVNRQTERRDA